MSLALKRARKRQWLAQREYKKIRAQAHAIVKEALARQQAELNDSYIGLAALVQARDGLLIHGGEQLVH